MDMGNCSNRKVKAQIRGRLFLLAYMIVVGTMLFLLNKEDDYVIQAWYRIGEGNLRGEDSRAVSAFAGLYGSWVYPFSVIGAGGFIWQAFTEKTIAEKIICACCAIICLFYLWCFVELGVFHFAWDS